MSVTWQTQIARCLPTPLIFLRLVGLSVHTKLHRLQSSHSSIAPYCTALLTMSSFVVLRTASTPPVEHQPFDSLYLANRLYGTTHTALINAAGHQTGSISSWGHQCGLPVCVVNHYRCSIFGIQCCVRICFIVVGTHSAPYTLSPIVQLQLAVCG